MSIFTQGGEGKRNPPPSYRWLVYPLADETNTNKLGEVIAPDAFVALSDAQREYGAGVRLSMDSQDVKEGATYGL